ncbi:arrestin domain-containing protein 2 [Aphomia sociella]
MGFQDGRIVLDSPNNAYYSGQTIQGRLIFERDKSKTFRGIYVRMKGYCKVHWTSQQSRRVNDRVEHRTINHDSHEEYIDHKAYLVGGKSGEHHLQPGKHEFPFSIHIPHTCPSSFEGSHGHIRYELKVVVDRAFKTDQEITAPVRIIAPLDLNTEQYTKDPIELEFHDSYCCWCISSGSSETLVKLPVTGYCPGQVIPVEVACNNKSSVEIEKIKIAIKKEVTFRAEHVPGTKSERDTVLEVKKGPIPANSTRNWAIELEVPSMDVYNLSNCYFIDIDYELKVTVSPEGCHDDTEDAALIIFGTVPLVGYQDNVKNPMQDQMPRPMITEQSQNYPGSNTAYSAPVINQPLPTASPYPGAAPYPGANPPYPGTNSPYPGANPPYPGANPPYPGANPPYPGPNPPYPIANPPYPIANPPYPGANPPYPGQNPGAHGVNPPFPNNASYQGTPGQPVAPYPASGVSPYPSQPGPPQPPYGSSPVPTTLVQSGTFGYSSLNHDGAPTIPLLPQGTNVPMPHIASAPPPSTPDDVGKPLAGNDIDSNPPYNPSFMNDNKKEENK